MAFHDEHLTVVDGAAGDERRAKTSLLAVSTWPFWQTTSTGTDQLFCAM